MNYDKESYEAMKDNVFAFYIDDPTQQRMALDGVNTGVDVLPSHEPLEGQKKTFFEWSSGYFAINKDLYGALAEWEMRNREEARSIALLLRGERYDQMEEYLALVEENTEEKKKQSLLSLEEYQDTLKSLRRLPKHENVLAMKKAIFQEAKKHPRHILSSNDLNLSKESFPLLYEWICASYMESVIFRPITKRLFEEEKEKELPNILWYLLLYPNFDKGEEDFVKFKPNITWEVKKGLYLVEQVSRFSNKEMYNHVLPYKRE